MKAILLARVSTKEQEESGLSIKEIQLPQLRKYAIDHNMEVVEEFVFQETASQKLRKNFDEMVDYLKCNEEVEAVVCFRVDRLTRNYRDAVEMDTLRVEHGKELHFVNDRLVLDENSRGKEMLEWDMKVFLAKQHINRGQEDAYNTIMSKLEAGDQYGKTPYGYKNIRDENNRASVKIDPFEAGIVKKVFEYYIQGTYSYDSIAKRLNMEFPTLKFKKRKVEQILINKYYYGNKEYKGKEYPHKYEKLIDQRTFETATQIREGRYQGDKMGRISGKSEAIYRGMIYCAECGCSYSPHPNRHTKLDRNVQSDHYYYCTNSKKEHHQKPKGTNDLELTKQFADLFKNLHIPEAELQDITRMLRESHEDEKEFYKTELDELHSEIQKRKNRIEGAYEDKLDGSITTDEYEEKRQKWSSEIRGFENKLAQLNQGSEDYYITASYLLDLASRSHELFMGSEPEQKRQLIILTLQNLEIKDGKLMYDWVKPFDTIFVNAKSHSWGG